MSKRKLYVYIVHEGTVTMDTSRLYPPVHNVSKDHRILGVYLDKATAEAHRNKYKNRGEWQGYVAITKHAVRGAYTNLDGLVII